MKGAGGKRARPPWILLAVGLFAGFIAGLFGVGGGIFVAPGLMLLGGFPQRAAHGTSLATSALFAAAGVVAYALNDAVDVVAASLIFAGSGLGVLAGVELLNRVRVRTLQVAFVLLLAVTAGRMLAGTPEAAGELSLTVAAAFALVGCGVLVGLVAGLMGVGGGVIVVPALVLIFELGDVTAKGTSLLVVLPTAIVGTLRNLRHDNVDLRGALLIGTGGRLAAFGGGLLAGVIAQEISAGLFAGLLMIIALRLARDIHDTVAQSLTGVIVHLEALEHVAGDATAASDHRARALDLARVGLREARLSVQGLRASALDGQDLSDALAAVVDRADASGQAAARFSLQGDAAGVPAPIANELLRIGEEALANALRHASPHHVLTSLQVNHDAVRLVIEDDGAGIDPADSSESGYGLLGMRERATRLGGTLSIESQPGEGTRVQAHIPLLPASDDR